VASGPASVTGGPTPGGCGLRPASVLVPTRLRQGGAGVTGGRWLGDGWLDGAGCRPAASGRAVVARWVRDSSLEQWRGCVGG
jgi:hypothetical protein